MTRYTEDDEADRRYEAAKENWEWKHRNDPPMMVCEDCGEKFPSRTQATICDPCWEHRQEFSCPECGEEVKEKGHLCPECLTEKRERAEADRERADDSTTIWEDLEEEASRGR